MAQIQTLNILFNSSTLCLCSAFRFSKYILIRSSQEVSRIGVIVLDKHIDEKARVHRGKGNTSSHSW